LAAYEMLKNVLPFPGKKAETATVKPLPTPVEDKSPIGYLRSRNAMKILLDLDPNFGRFNSNSTKDVWKILPSRKPAA